MRLYTRLAAFCGLFFLTFNTQALELGSEDFLAARAMTCVLAQESLGYLNDEDFADLAESIMEGYDQAQGDVVYAQALGYFDGLMFGLPAGDQRAVNTRLQEYISSGSCRLPTSGGGVLRAF